MTALAAAMVTSPALAQEITVWDVDVDEPSHATYYDHAKAAFEAAQPDAKLTFLSQPDAEYDTLLGTALAPYGSLPKRGHASDERFVQLSSADQAREQSSPWPTPKSRRSSHNQPRIGGRLP